MRILFTICGRAGSKGIKNKNIRMFLGKPLPLYTVSAIDLYMRRHMTDDIDIALNTDSSELVEIMKKNKMQPIAVVDRKVDLAGDTVPKPAVIQDTYLEMKKRKQYDYDMVIDMDITSPLRTVEDVEMLINKKKETECDVAFTVTDARRNPYFNMVKKGEHGYERVISSNCVARQQAPEIFDMNASIYAYSPAFLMSGKGMFEGYCEVSKMLDTGILDLDHENDFGLMEVIAKYLFENKEQFAEVYDNIK